MSQQIIEWSIDGIRIVSADATGRVSQAVLWDSFEHHDTSFTAQELGEKLKKWLSSQSISPGTATLLLPREMVVVRQLQLPQSPDDELPDLVKFQSASKSSMAIDDLALDYIKLESSASGGGQAVLTASIDRKRLRRIREILTTAGFEVQHATITPIAIGQFVKQFAGASLGQSQPEMVVFQRKSLIELTIFDRGALVFSHSMVLPETNRLKPLESGITRSIIALNQTHPNVDIDHCFAVGTAEDEDVLQLLNKKFPGNVKVVQIPESLKSFSDINGYEPLIGAGLPIANSDSRIDLLNPRKRAEKPDRRKWYWIGGGTAAALLMLMVYGSFSSRKSGLEASIAALNDSISETDRKLKEGDPQLEAFQSIDSWKTGKIDPVSVWNRLRNHMPGTDRLYMSELRLQPVVATDSEARFTGVGFARLRNDVDNLNQQLAENGFRVTPQATTTSSRDPDYPIRFELNVEVIKIVDSDPKVTQSSKKQSSKS